MELWDGMILRGHIIPHLDFCRQGNGGLERSWYFPDISGPGAQCLCFLVSCHYREQGWESGDLGAGSLSILCNHLQLQENTGCQIDVQITHYTALIPLSGFIQYPKDRTIQPWKHIMLNFYKTCVNGTNNT